MIQRRTILKTSAAVAMGAPALVGFAQQVVTLKFHTFLPAQSGVWQGIHKAWMDKVEATSRGRIKFQAFPAMQLGGTPAQLYDQVRDGVADICWTLPGYTPGRFPRAEAFELPFMMTNAEATSRAYWDYVQNTAAVDDFKETRLLALHVHGSGVIHTVGKPVLTAADLKGMRMRAPTRQVAKLLGFLGATPVTMPLPAVTDALSKRQIDGCVLPWEAVPGIGLHELAKFHAEFDPAGGSLYTSAFAMVMNKDKYNSLDSELKRVIDEHSGPVCSAWLGKMQQGLDPKGRKAAVDAGNKVTVLDPPQAQMFRRLSRLVEVEWAEELTKRDMNGYKLLDKSRELIDKYTRAPSPVWGTFGPNAGRSSYKG